MKKYTPYILILFILIGLFSPTIFVQAAPPDTDVPFITDSISAEEISTSTVPVITEGTIFTSTTSTVAPPKTTNFNNAVNDKLCVLAHPLTGGTIAGCFVQTFYLLLYQLPAFLLTQVAYFFNVIISVTLNGDLFKLSFVSQAWGIVRDLSNIFFILILLYVAIKVILGLGGSEVKKMIAKVIIIALLINFSMFFTQIIIDSSNILASIFYNKLQVNTMNDKPREYASIEGEPDVAGEMVAAFDPTSTLKPEFFEQAKQVYKNNEWVKKETEVPAPTLIALILLAGAIMIFATYALLISGLSFLGRLIELWVLIIAAP
ncbi:hypothetical protein KKG24_02855, partial [Patescibacteria group bacterium]|nr:hypothetical protein [Patescibacteria group bacterium]